MVTRDVTQRIGWSPVRGIVTGDAGAALPVTPGSGSALLQESGFALLTESANYLVLEG